MNIKYKAHMNTTNWLHSILCTQMTTNNSQTSQKNALGTNHIEECFALDISDTKAAAPVTSHHMSMCIVYVVKILFLCFGFTREHP